MVLRSFWRQNQLHGTHSFQENTILVNQFGWYKIIMAKIQCVLSRYCTSFHETIYKGTNTCGTGFVASLFCDFIICIGNRVAEVDSLSARAKMAIIKTFVKRVFTISRSTVVFALICNFANSTQYNMQCLPCEFALLAQKHYFWPKKKTLFCPFPLSAWIATNLNLGKK